MIPFNVSNIKELSKVGKENIVIVNSVGAKKKMEIIKKAEEMKLNIFL